MAWVWKVKRMKLADVLDVPIQAFAAAQSDPGLTRFGYNESIVSYSSIAVDELASEVMKSRR